MGNARENFERYIRSHDPQYVAEDAVFHDTASGQEYRGREAVGQMLDWIYHRAFDAQATTDNWFITEDGTKAVVEGMFEGTHIGEFAGIPPTNRHVRTPLCVVYDLRDGFITDARVYLQVAVLMGQLTAPAEAPVATS